MRRLAIVVCLLAFIAIPAGCNSNPETGRVTGTVTYKGQPLESGSIIFETQGARPAVGQIVNGKIVEVTTYQPGDGVPLGVHQVAIQSVTAAEGVATQNPGDNAAGAGYMRSESLIPAIYGDPQQSGLTAEIKPGVNELHFELKEIP